MKDASMLLRLVHESMLKLNLDTQAIYQKCGVTAAHIQNTKSRLKHNATDVFWAVVEEVSCDKDVGLHVAENLPLYKGHVLEYLFLSSHTFGDGLNRALNYQRLLTDIASSYIVKTKGSAALVLDTKLGDKLNHQFAECISLGIIRFFKSVTNDEFTATCIDFMFDKPSDVSEYERIFNCKIRFSQPQTTIHFSSDVLSCHSVHAEPELLKLHEQVAEQHVARLEQEDLVIEVKRVIGELLDNQEVSLEMVAQKLNLTPRNLRARLSLAGTNFNNILADYRSLLAKRLLVRTSESIDEIVYLTGFSEPSTFYRAFKRWTGLTPVEYRKSKKGSRELDPA
jgi:AraC-like DNA-binding protein